RVETYAQLALGPWHDVLTSPLALKEALRLTEAFASACTALPAQAISFPPRVVTWSATPFPVVTTWFAASSTILLWVCTKRTIFGRFALTVSMTACTSAETV